MSKAFSQISPYNDSFDFNLKGNPKSIKEVSLFSMTDSILFNLHNDFTMLSSINEYKFDTSGNIIKEYSKWVFSPSGSWRDYSQKETFNYKDSVITLYHDKYSDKYEVRRYYDEQGYLIRKISTSSPDTIIYKRNLDHRIYQSYEHYIGTDSQQITTLSNEYNSNGDVQKQKRCDKRFGIMYIDSGPSIHETIYEYKYIYDSANNWIMKISFINDSISEITQRKINY